MCMSPSSLGNCSTWCIMICLVIPILSLLLFIQSLYSLSYLSLVLFLLLLVIITLDIIPTTIGTSKRSNYTSQELNLFNFIVPPHVLRPAPVHTCTLTCLGLITSEPKGLTTKSSQGENVFPCNKFISSCIIMCIDFVAMTCNIMYCRTDMYQN